MENNVKIAENIHKNHRKRLLDNIFKSGIENVSEINALEFILTYIIPRKDTNPLAHNLIKEFGNLANVLDADFERLKNFPGLGERTAKLIVLLPQIFYRYKLEKQANKKYLKNMGDIINFYLALYENKNVEEFYITCLDLKNKVLANKKISGGNINSIKIDKKEFTILLVNSKASKVIISHCHPESSCLPSRDDINSTKAIIEVANLLGIDFIDHIIVGIDGCYSYSHLEIIK
ncbi:MAG: JAB domain-containing protein [Clostridia bacterium]|jgi:DNA repair protein RadC|nr:JAB domain-containing protein [Clostridia bacterium]MDD3232482.1 JAB domain-containing protein [Clostridia bacterium]